MDCKSEFEVGLHCRRKRPNLQEGVEEKEDELMDRISDLPDHILTQVLSLLEIDEAIRTSILSSRWRNLWKGVTRIHLCQYGPTKFSNIVEHVLRNCCSTNFLSFTLDCPVSVNVSRLNTWIGCLRSHKLIRLSIIVNNADIFDAPEPPLPQCSISWSTLVFLKLDCFNIEIPDSTVSLPSLKSLDLRVIFPNSEAAVNRLLSSCPVLENLDLFGFLDDFKSLKLDISVPTLRGLNLELKNQGYSYKREHDIIIDTPNLENLSIDDDSFSRYVVKKLAWVSHAYVNFDTLEIMDVRSEYINRVLQLLKGISAAEILTLQSGTVDVLGVARSYAWPTFPYLTALILNLDKFVGWTCMSKMLQIAPDLNLLFLDLEGLNDGDNRPSGDDEDDLYQWTPPHSVPSCLLEHLELIGVKDFEGNKNELLAVEYLLNNAQVLECMMIGYDQRLVNEEVVEKIMTFPRASKSCDVQIYSCVEFEFDSATLVTTIWGS